jgi:hypothetical protein
MPQPSLLNLLLALLCIGLSGRCDDILFDGNLRAKGVKIVPDPEAPGNRVALWRNAAKGHRCPVVVNERDLSAFKALSFRFYSAAADNRTIFVLVDSTADPKVGNYYYAKFVVTWKGWRTLVLPFDDFIKSRRPLGWQKVNRIQFANSGYGGAKPNPDALYCLDDVTALSEVPLQAASDPNASSLLAPGNRQAVYRFEVDPTKEAIYGIQYEIMGEPGANLKLGQFRTWRKDGDEIQNDDLMGSSWKPTAADDWESRRLEILVRKGAADLELTFALHGKRPIRIRNVEVRQGGFPENPPHPEAPYLDWIEALSPNLDYAKASPLLTFAKGGASIWNYRKGSPVYLRNEDMKKTISEVAPFRAVSVERLIELTPRKRPFQFNSGCWGLRYKWTPANPDVIINAKTGQIFDPEKEFPIEGYEEVVAPSGKTVRYAYHDYKKTDPEYKGQRAYVERFYKKDRIYVERFMTDARLNALHRAGTQMAMLFHKTGDMEYGVRAAAILWATARNMTDWPVWGKPSWNSPREQVRLQPPDYYSWFSFVMDINWYVTNGNIMWTARYFDLLRDTNVWDQLAKQTNIAAPKETVADGLLHIAQMYLKRDAFYRNSPWVLFHNLAGTENRSLILLARVLGIPDLIHYSLRKIQGTFKKRFMADGVFPESQWYTMDQYGRQSGALDCLWNYRDPDGFVSQLDGTRLDITDPKSSIPTYKIISEALARQTYPDATAFTVHDSWSETSNPNVESYRPKWPVRDENSPYLFSSFGHGVLARGRTPDRIGAHLHYSGCYNHAHKDMLNLIFWAYGDELLSDIGYSHITSYNSSTLSHNLVVVDRSPQVKNAHAGSLLTWNGRVGATQIIQSDQGSTPAYPECSLYRRALLLLPFGPGQNAVIDIFEVEGGRRHDWMANGCADYEQTVSTDLRIQHTRDNLALDGKAVENSYPWGDTNETKFTADRHGEPSIWYGAFRNAKFAPIDQPWTVTMSPGKLAPKQAKWAGKRAVSTDPKPSMRLHWLQPLDGTAILAEAPRNRYNRELHNKTAARQVWSKLRMPKIIVNREGDKLKSTFVAVWEPFHKTAFLDGAQTLPDLNGDGFGWSLTAGTMKKTILYRPPEHRGTLGTAGLATDGRFAVKTENGSALSLDLSGGTFIATDDLAVELAPNPDFEILGLEQETAGFVLKVRGRVQQTLEQRTYDNEYLCFAQDGNSNRWLKISRIEAGGDHSRIVLAADPGFTFNPEKGILTETCFPHRVLAGKAVVRLPSWLNLKASPSPQGTTLHVRSSSPATLVLKGRADQTGSVQVRRDSAKQAYADLPFSVDGQKVTIPVTPDHISDAWLEIRLADN